MKLKLELKFKSILIILILFNALIAFTGCGKPISQLGLNSKMNATTLDEPNDIQTDRIDSIPNHFPPEPVIPETKEPELTPNTPTEKPVEKETKKSPEPPVVVKKTEPKKTEPPIVVKKPIPTHPAPVNSEKISAFIQQAHQTMVTEGKKIGTPCNFYLSRVLVNSGYSKAGFLANSFDIYAKNYFSNYRTETFIRNHDRNDESELQRYIDSFKERTPFILQWKNNRTRGHLAILERINKTLVIYQASIGKHTARREITDVKRLLNYSPGSRVIVYSDFSAK